MEDDDSERGKENNNNNNNNSNHELILRVLELLKQASHDLHSHPSSSSSSIHALLQLHSDSLLSFDPNLSRLSLLLSSLKSLSDTKPSSFFLRRRSSSHQLSRVAAHIESELQSWIDRESLQNLVNSSSDDTDSLLDLLSQFQHRISQGFNREFQDLVLKSKVFAKLESILCNPDCSLALRERAAEVIEALIHFNKNVFVGQVLMGKTVRALIEVNSFLGLRVLCSLIRSIKSPLVDEIESNDMLPKIMGLLECDDVRIRGLALDCVLEIGYFGRKEAIDSMMAGGIVRRLVELQRSELGGDLIDVGRCEEEREMAAAEAEAVEEVIVEEDVDRRQGGGRRDSRERYLEKHPFASCVARFAVQLEVGEGLRQREKRAFKLEVLKRVREASVSDAEAATIGAEVLWGSSL